MSSDAACDVTSENSGSSALWGDLCGEGHLPQFPAKCTGRFYSDLQSEHLIRCRHSEALCPVSSKLKQKCSGHSLPMCSGEAHFQVRIIYFHQVRTKFKEAWDVACKGHSIHSPTIVYTFGQ